MSSPKRGGGAGDGGKGKRAAVVLALPAERSIFPEHRKMLDASGLTPETCELAELYSTANATVISKLLERRASASAGSVLVLPFYLPGASAPHAYRVRPTHPRVIRRNGKDVHVKYDQASGAGMLVYFPPRARAAGAFGIPNTSAGESAEGGDRRSEPPALSTLYWTEGEKKSLLLDQLGLTCVGLTGVWMAGDKAYRDLTHGERLHPHIREHVQIAGRQHVIVFDGDARDNDQVMHAARKLAGMLLAAGAVSVRFAIPPDADAAKGIDDYYAQHGEAATRALLAAAGEIEPLDPKAPLVHVSSCGAVKDAPLPAAIVLPEGYSIARDGALWHDEGGKRGPSRVTHTPMLIARKLIDVHEGDERVELVYRHAESGGAWRHIAATRRAITDSRQIVAELAPYGAPVTSTSASSIVDWLDAYEHQNAEHIPRLACVSSAGWHTVDKARVFASHEVITPEDSGLKLALDMRGDKHRLVAALTPRGTLEGHVAALRRAWEADATCAAMLTAAFAATLLDPLQAPNFAVHLPGESSRGKTSMLKIAASVFGRPEHPAWVANWGVSAAAAEARAVALNDLPQCYDEVGSGDSAAVEKLVYQLINGSSRPRASRDGSERSTRSWRTILLSTGERRLVDETAATGAQVRCIQLPVSGFGTLGAADIDALVRECSDHAGRAGDEWLRSLVEGDAEYWADKRKRLREIERELREGVSDPLRARGAGYFALLVLAEEMLAATEGLKLGDPYSATMRAVYAGRADEHVEPLAERALTLAREWILGEGDAFPEIERLGITDEYLEPKNLATRSRAGFRAEGRTMIIPSAFREFCKRNRLDGREVLRQWAAREWIAHDRERLDKMVRVGKHAAHKFIVLLP